MFLPFATFIAKADGRNISAIASARYWYRLQTVVYLRLFVSHCPYLLLYN